MDVADAPATIEAPTGDEVAAPSDVAGPGMAAFLMLKTCRECSHVLASPAVAEQGQVRRGQRMH